MISTFQLLNQKKIRFQIDQISMNRKRFQLTYQFRPQRIVPCKAKCGTRTNVKDIWQGRETVPNAA